MSKVKLTTSDIFSLGMLVGTLYYERYDKDVSNLDDNRRNTEDFMPDDGTENDPYRNFIELYDGAYVAGAPDYLFHDRCEQLTHLHKMFISCINPEDMWDIKDVESGDSKKLNEAIYFNWQSIYIGAILQFMKDNDVDIPYIFKEYCVDYTVIFNKWKDFLKVCPLPERKK